MFMFKKAVRDSSRVVRLVSIAQLFRILDNFSVTKKKSAPAIYKTLVFSLVESPSEPTVRELMFSNFIQLMDDNPGIPINMLIEPLFKIIPIQLGLQY
jgi:hypothetical protein